MSPWASSPRCLPRLRTQFICCYRSWAGQSFSARTSSILSLLSSSQEGRLALRDCFGTGLPHSSSISLADCCSCLFAEGVLPYVVAAEALNRVAEEIARRPLFHTFARAIIGAAWWPLHPNAAHPTVN